MTNGVDEAYEQTVQTFDLVADSGLLVAVGTLTCTFGPVPSGQNWLVERISIRYRPGAVPTDIYVPFRLQANSTGPADLREGSELAPKNGWTAATGYDFFADEAAPVRFFSGEQVIATAPSYGAAAPNTSRLVVTLQIRAVRTIPGANLADSTPVEEVAPVDRQPAHEPTWG